MTTTTDCAHKTKGRQLAHIIAELASEREAYRLTGNRRMVAEIEHSIAMTQLSMEWNFQDHEEACT